MEISYPALKLISQALATQIRLLRSYVNQSEDNLFRISQFETLKEDIDDMLLRY